MAASVAPGWTRSPGACSSFVPTYPQISQDGRVHRGCRGGRPRHRWAVLVSSQYDTAAAAGAVLLLAQTRAATRGKSGKHTSAANRRRVSLSASASASGFGILESLSDLPKTEALGIELRATAATAVPIRMTDKGSFAEEPLLVRHSFEGGTVEANREAICQTIRDLVNHFRWKGVVGISVTIEISKQLGIFGEDFAQLERQMGGMFSKFLRGKATFVHTLIHTDAAAYEQLVFGESADERFWRGQLLLICSLGKHLGAVLFSDGRRIRNSPLNAIFTSKWNATISGLNWLEESHKFKPPQPGDPDFKYWAELVDKQVREIADFSSMIDRIIVVPTGRTAAIEGLPDALSGTLVKTREVVSEASVVHPSEGCVVRGAALAALVELQTLQALRSFNSVISGDQALHSLSDGQLRRIFDKIDTDADASIVPTELQKALSMIGIECDIDELVRELDTSHDGKIAFPEFMNWWMQEVKQANIVLLTSVEAWRRMLHRPSPDGFGDIILLEVTFTFCRSCRAFAAKFRRYAQRYKDVRFVQIVGNGTIGAMEFCTKELGVKVSPAFFVFRRGCEKQLASWTGGNTEKFESELEACLQMQ